MNENLQQAMAEIIQASLSAVETAKNFLSEQIPDVIQQLLLWHFTASLIYFVCGILMLVTVVVANYKAFKYMKADDDDNALLIMMLSAGGGAVLAVLGFAALNLKWLQIWIAPKIFLIEYAARMFK